MSRISPYLYIDENNLAKLSTANAFTVGGHSITNDAAGTLPLFIRSASGQTENLQAWQTSAGGNLARISPNGSIATAGNLAVGAVAITNANQLQVTSTSATNIGAVVRGANGQLANLQEWQTNAPTTVASISSAGVLTASGITLPSQTANTFLAAPNSAAGVPSFRVLSYNDIYPAGPPSTFGQVVQYAPVGGGMAWSSQVPVYPATPATFTNAITFSAGAIFSGITSPITLNGQVGTSGQVLSSAGTGATPTWRSGPIDATTTTATNGFGYMGLPQNSTTTGSYTIVAADAGEHIYASATRTVTIPANSALALPIGTTLTFIAGAGATMTIAITTDTMYLAGAGTTGSRTLAAHGIATAVKTTATTWIISGNGLT